MGLWWIGQTWNCIPNAMLATSLWWGVRVGSNRRVSRANPWKGGEDVFFMLGLDCSPGEARQSIELPQVVLMERGWAGFGNVV